MIIYRRAHRVLVQGITGKQGTFWTEKMMACGTTVIGGVNPKRTGENHLGVPIYASAAEAMRQAPFEVAVMFIPPSMAKAAALDAIDAGAKLLVVLTEHIPTQDVMAILLAASRNGTLVVGPNTAGLVTPGEGFVGIMPGHNSNVFSPRFSWSNFAQRQPRDAGRAQLDARRHWAIGLYRHRRRPNARHERACRAAGA